MSRNLRSRLNKLEQTAPSRGNNWVVCITCQDRSDADRLRLDAYKQLLSRGYQPDRHLLRLFFFPDNGRSGPKRPTIRIERYP